MHLEVLDEKRKKLFNIFKKLSFLNDFELGGGTALALQIGHRISIDFDFFKASFLDLELLGKIEKEFKGEVSEVVVNTKEELTIFIDGVKVTFLNYPFPRVLPAVNSEGLKILSVQEIALTKAYTIGRRVEYKDYVDLYFLLKDQHVTLEQIIDLSNKKYGTKFNSRLFLEQLLANDVEETKINFLEKTVSKEEMFEFFSELISSLKGDF